MQVDPHTSFSRPSNNHIDLSGQVGVPDVGLLHIQHHLMVRLHTNDMASADFLALPLPWTAGSLDFTMPPSHKALDIPLLRERNKVMSLQYLTVS